MVKSRFIGGALRDRGETHARGQARKRWDDRRVAVSETMARRDIPRWRLPPRPAGATDRTWVGASIRRQPGMRRTQDQDEALWRALLPERIQDKLSHVGDTL